MIKLCRKLFQTITTSRLMIKEAMTELHYKYSQTTTTLDLMMKKEIIKFHRKKLPDDDVILCGD